MCRTPSRASTRRECRKLALTDHCASQVLTDWGISVSVLESRMFTLRYLPCQEGEYMILINGSCPKVQHTSRVRPGKSWPQSGYLPAAWSELVRSLRVSSGCGPTARTRGTVPTPHCSCARLSLLLLGSPLCYAVSLGIRSRYSSALPGPGSAPAVLTRGVNTCGPILSSCGWKLFVLPSPSSF